MTRVRPFRRIPNPQVLDAAEQFHDGFIVLFDQPSHSGVLLPSLHCASIAIELYLKALSAREVEDPVPDADGGGAYIYAEAASRSHKLEELLDAAEPAARDAIEHRAGGCTSLAKFGTFRDVLRAYSPMFISSRYPFESTSSLEDVSFPALTDLLDVLRFSVRSLAGLVPR